MDIAEGLCGDPGNDFQAVAHLNLDLAGVDVNMLMHEDTLVTDTHIA